MPHLRVLAPGMQTTVQDLGRPGYAHLGVSASGAADPVSLRLGNWLAGNPPGAAALEMTLVGGAFAFDDDVIVAFTGADFGATLDGQPLPNWQACAVRPGQVVRCGVAKLLARGYLCVHGGLDVLAVLGSASTHLTTSLGGMQGRALVAGDAIPLCTAGGPAAILSRRVRPATVARLLQSGPLAATSGPHAALFTAAARDLFTGSVYHVTEAASRMGLRLAGPALRRHANDDLLTEGVSLGAVQVPPDGQPILSFVEHQTTGGYPKIANVIAADLHRVGQLRPRDPVRFEFVGIERAIERLAQLEALLAPRALESA